MNRMRRHQVENQRWTPVLDDAAYKSLFGVVRDIRPQAIENFAIVTVAATNDFGSLHPRAERKKDARKRGMKELATELSEF